SDSMYSIRHGRLHALDAGHDNARADYPATESNLLASDRRLDLAENVAVLRLKRLPGATLAADRDHGLVLGTVADHGHRLLAALDPLHLLDQHLAIEDHALVA